MFEIFTLAFVIASSYWVLFDAKKHKMGSRESDTPSPYRILFGCLILWILIVPYYLFKRKDFIRRSVEFPNEKDENAIVKVAAYAVTVLIVIIQLNFFLTGDVSKCDAKEVTTLVSEIAHENYGSGYAFSNFGQVGYDHSNEVRYCRASWSNAEKSGVIDFTVEWYDENRENIYVSFK